MSDKSIEKPIVLTIQNLQLEIQPIYKGASHHRESVETTLSLNHKQTQQADTSNHKTAVGNQDFWIYNSTIFASRLTVSNNAMVDLPLKYPQTSPGFTTNDFPS